MRNLNYANVFFFAFSSLLISISQVFLYIDKPQYISIVVLFIIFLFIALSEIKNYVLIFICCLFSDIYIFWPLRLQVVSLSAYLLIFYYITNFKTSFFNNYKLPKPLKISAAFLSVAVLMSLFFSKFFSVQAILLTIVFFGFLTTSFIVFKSPFTPYDVFKYLKYFIVGVSVSSVTILIQIVLTGNLRSVGLVGFPIMDFLVISLLVTVFYYYILGKSTKVAIGSTFVCVCVLITTQSRFAWFGFLVSFFYGLIICIKKESFVLEFLKKKAIWFFVGSMILGAILVVLGLDKVFIARFSDLSPELFKGTSEGDLISNSLETRILIWITAYYTFIDNAITGVGYQMFSEVSGNYNVFPEYFFQTFILNLDAHTTFLNFLVDTGVIGFLCFVSYITTIFVYSYKAINISTDKFERKISIILNILVFFIIFHSIYSGAFTFGTNAFIMHFIFGLTIFNYAFLKRKYNELPNL